MTVHDACNGHENGFVHLDVAGAGLDLYDLGEKWEERVEGLPRSVQKKLYHVSYRRLDDPEAAPTTINYVRTESLFTADDRRDMKKTALERLAGDVAAGRQGETPI